MTKVVLAGAGGYGALYVDALLRSGAELTGVVDPYAEKSARYAQIADRPVYDDLSAFFAAHSADLAIISSPIHLHTRQVLEALEHGCHVLCEKPLCVTAREAEQICEAAEVARRTVMVGFQWSFAPAMLAAKRDILAGRYGKALTMRAKVLWPRNDAYYARNNWAGRIRTPGGDLVCDSVVGNGTAHYLHNMLFMLGDSPASSRMPDAIDGLLYRAHAIENYDTAFVKLRLGETDVFFATSHACACTRDPYAEYTFEQGRLFVQNFMLYGVLGGKPVLYGAVGDGSAVDEKLAAALETVETGAPATCTAATVLPTVRVTEALQARPIQTIAPFWICREQDPPRDYVPVLDGLMDRAFEQMDWGGELSCVAEV